MQVQNSKQKIKKSFTKVYLTEDIQTGQQFIEPLVHAIVHAIACPVHVRDREKGEGEKL